MANKFIAQIMSVWRGKPAISNADERRLYRKQVQNGYQQDTAEERKRAWLRTIRPRLSKGESGAWWCASKHETPQHISPMGTKVYYRVGCGSTPREAYDSWTEF